MEIVPKKGEGGWYFPSNDFMSIHQAILQKSLSLRKQSDPFYHLKDIWMLDGCLAPKP